MIIVKNNKPIPTEVIIMVNTNILDESIVNGQLVVKYLDEQLDDIIIFELPTTNPVKNISKISFSTYMIETSKNEQFLVK